MKAQELLSRASDAMQAKRVFGEPYEKNGITVIPVAVVRGGWGGGGQGQSEDQSGWGGGGGLAARGLGAFVIKGDTVTWQPAIDVNRVILMGQMLALALILTVGATLRARSKRR
jgi:uncharacterized spore protein YtfJ